MKHKIVIEGLAVKYNDKYWGIKTEGDGRTTDSYDYVDIIDAKISDSKFFTKPTDITWTPEDGRHNPDYDKLSKGVIVKIRKTIIAEEI